MSDAAIRDRVRGPGTETVLIAGFVLIVLGILWYGISMRQQVLRNSTTGFDGLQAWLSSEGLSAQGFSGGWQIDQSTIGLLVLPIYDTRPGKVRPTPETSEELLFQQDENDLTYDLIRDKARRVDALIALPKWRSAMRLEDVGHPELRVEAGRLDAMLRQLTGIPAARLSYSGEAFTTFSYRTGAGRSLTAEIYAAQLFDAPGCKPMIGRPGAMLLADCPLAGGKGQRRVLVLSDPDVFNNHGLRLGDNAFIARDLFRKRAGDRNILIDYSLSNWLREPRNTARRERTWADLKRFFSPPFTLLWVGAALTLGLFLWRAARRNGPVRADVLGPGASKTVAIAARARLMRLADQDGAMVKEYARARVAATAAAMVGPAEGHRIAGSDAFLQYLRRRHPDFAEPLAAALSEIERLPQRIGANEAMQHVDELERILEQITHDT
ncbi:hypothetical protein GGD81_003046 [Rhodobium orientis]|uniref:DUF4350 domain-containing protein n=1 Tax=Rhodobium orientis TaxID=34017 RepID=A0A327JVP1_9HYPH|nr:hypothetical protein [Rhodobium orientis]MBB4303991.1 hypothetical protein [Rhodobium orientis]MBK5950799.1 hypothetical protein [Rhodobium orientis]RAI29533.1 hypothetical protein CH339_02475 [Rhodobium orientis]